MTLARPVDASAREDKKRAANSLARLLALGRPVVMGVLNVTPDSFSDGGRFLDPALRSSRPGAWSPKAPTSSTSARNRPAPMAARCRFRSRRKLRRLEPVLPAVVALGVPVSIDTMKAEVAAWALAAGAAIVNDVWGLQRDPDMARVVAEHGVPVIIMHNREAADPAIDIMADIAAFFSRSLEIAARAGIAREHIVLDPGIGFGKTPEQSITAIARLAELKSFGLPLLIGASRKRFIDKSLARAARPAPRRIDRRPLLAVADGAAIMRAHDVAETVQALRVAAAIQSAR